MFKAIVQKLYAPVKAGNQYREEKYGKPMGFVESYKHSREIWERHKNSQPATLSMFASSRQIENIENFKNRFQYWEEWSGSRFILRENPNFDTPEGRKIQIGTVCRSNPVTGFWECVE